MSYYTSKISIAIIVMSSIVAIFGTLIGLILFGLSEGDRAVTAIFVIISSLVQWFIMIGFSMIVEASHRYIKTH